MQAAAHQGGPGTFNTIIIFIGPMGRTHTEHAAMLGLIRHLIYLHTHSDDRMVQLPDKQSAFICTNALFPHFNPLQPRNGRNLSIPQRAARRQHQTTAFFSVQSNANMER